MSQKHILLADADAQTLEEFRTALGEQWTIKAVGTGAAALEELKRQSYDGLAASLYLPDLGTGQLFNKVRNKYPQIVRFVIALEKDRERVVKEVLGAHQFLIRPFEADGLRTIIERALAFDLWIDSDKLHKLVARMRSLPTVPALYLEILSALRSPDTTTDEVGEMIAKDMAISTKLLQVINSAYFGLPRTITSPSEAVGLLGFETAKSMVMAVKLLNQYDRLKLGNFSVEKLWEHSTAVAHNARRLVLLQTGERALAEEAFTAGLLHDVGKAVLAANFTEQYQGAQSLARKQGIPIWEVEKEIFGASHGEIGAYLLGLWGLPVGVLEPAALHHQPGRTGNKIFSALSAVHVGNTLQHELAADLEGEAIPRIDTQYLQEIGMSECLPAWREEILGPEAVVNDPDTEQFEPGSPLPRPNLTSVPPPGASLTGNDETAAPTLELCELEATGQVVETDPTPAVQQDNRSEVEEAQKPVLDADPDQSPATTSDVMQLDPGTFSEWQKPPVEASEMASAGTSRAKSMGPWITVGVVLLLGLLVAWLVMGWERRQKRDALVVKAEPIKSVPSTNGSEASATVQHRETVTAVTQNAVETNIVRLEKRSLLELTNSLSAPALLAATNSAGPSASSEIVFPELRLQGVLFSQTSPSAIINGSMVHPKESILGVRIVEIKRTSVVIEYQHQRKVLSLE